MQEEVSVLLEDHRTDGNRSGEGSMVELANGDLLFVYGVFNGGNDESPARLVQRHSKDGGRTWSERAPFMELPAGTCNIMSVSLKRLADGRLGCVYIHKLTPTVDDILFMVSEDEGATWRKPLSVSGNDGLYYVVNNDRLAQLSAAASLSICPALVCARLIFRRRQMRVFISDDGGRSWRHGDSAGLSQPRSATYPWRRRDKQRFEKCTGKTVLQEPGVIGFGWARAHGRAQTQTRLPLSADAGESW